jgi:sporulation protein YlmC with PRC-barrel domain
MTPVSELSLGAMVSATDGDVGTLRALIVDAGTGVISHLAVTNSDVPNSARLIPLRHVVQADAHHALLDLTRREALACQRLVVPGAVPDAGDHGTDETASAWFTDMDLSSGEYTFALRRRLPSADSVLLERGRRVETPDGHRLGVIDDVVVDHESGTISHIVLTHGHLLGRRQVVLPASSLVEITPQRVRVEVSPTSLDGTARADGSRA